MISKVMTEIKFDQWGASAHCPLNKQLRCNKSCAVLMRNPRSNVYYCGLSNGALYTAIAKSMN